MLSPGTDTGKDQGLPQPGTELLYSASLSAWGAEEGQPGFRCCCRSSFAPKPDGFLVLECCSSAVWGSAAFHGITAGPSTDVPGPGPCAGQGNQP